MYRVTIDIGGTFTDCLVLDGDGRLSQFKAPTTPADPSKGFLDCLEKAARAAQKDVREFIGAVEFIIHGTTLATNAVLTERGAKLGMLTTEGFRDEVEIRRGFKNIRTSMYNLAVPPYKPLVRRYLRLPVRERTLYSGEIETPVDISSVKAALDKFEAEKVQAIAICFLHSYANPENERKTAEICREQFDGKVYVTTSHEILPVSGEYERFSTTIVSAYIGPIVSDYLLALEKRLSDMGFTGSLLMVRSDGLVQSAAHSRRQAVTLINSGPAAAPTAAHFFGRLLGHNNLISIDMGGTSLDASLIRNGEIPTTIESWVGNERVAIKIVEMQSIGAGGGSLAWIDSLGLLRVGPQSAGSDPGPACYGRGGDRPTVTDADVLLGYIPADYFLGGEIKLDADQSRQAIRKVAEPLKMTESQAAQAIFKIVNSLMVDQVIELSTKRGYDIRDFALIVGGGAGAVHGAHIAELMGIPIVIIPKYAALYSAFGMFAMDIGREYSQSFMVRTDKLDLKQMESVYRGLTEKAIADFAEGHVAASELISTRTAQMRYVGQFHEIEVPLPSELRSTQDLQTVLETFHARHKELYKFDLPQRGIEFRTLSLRATVARKHDLKAVPLARGDADARAALKRTRRCLFGEDWIETPCYDGARLLAGNSIPGPAIIEEQATTIVVPERFVCTVDASGSYLLTRSKAMGQTLMGPTAVAKALEKPVQRAVEVDPLTLSTVWHSLQRICREMRRVIERTTQSYLISQLKDISVGIWDGQGNTVAIPVGLPAQFVGAKYSVRYIMNEYGKDIYPGDVFLANDPYKGYSCHPPDWGFFRPVFDGDRPVFWTLARAHVEDTGAAFPGAYFSDPYDIHSEGLLVPGVKVIEKGQEQRDIMRLIFNNVRLAEGVRSDSYALIAATKLAENRLLDLIGKYGIETVLDCMAVMRARTDQAVRACIRAMPDGTYYGESSTDDDGAELDVPVTVRCEITVKGDRLTIDFSRSDKQRKGFVNCSYPTTYSCAVAASILFFDPALAEYHNEGTMQPIEVLAPEGLVVNANYPAPMGGAPVSMGGNIQEAVMMALSAALPTRAAAGWGRRYGQYIYGIDPRTGGLYVFPGYHAEGGAGAVYGYDGYQGTASIGTLGEIARPNTEDYEIKYPWKVISREFRKDSSGAGKWKGGSGLHWEVVNLGGEAGMHTGAGQGETTYAHGCLGGKSSLPNTCIIERRNGEKLQAKVHRLHKVYHGDHIIKDTSGGGGVGRPEERDPQAVWDDVYINELVTIEAAREVYKVVIDPVIRQIDWDQTKSLRVAAMGR